MSACLACGATDQSCQYRQGCCERCDHRETTVVSRDRHYIESMYGDVVSEIVAEVRERIAADIEAQGHPDGYHRPGLTRAQAAPYCGNCAWTIEHARIARGTA